MVAYCHRVKLNTFSTTSLVSHPVDPHLYLFRSMISVQRRCIHRTWQSHLPHYRHLPYICHMSCLQPTEHHSLWSINCWISSIWTLLSVTKPSALPHQTSQKSSFQTFLGLSLQSQSEASFCNTISSSSSSYHWNLLVPPNLCRLIWFVLGSYETADKAILASGSLTNPN